MLRFSFLLALLILVSCRDNVKDRKGNIEDRAPALNAISGDQLADSLPFDRIDPDDYSKEQLTEMATETGEVNTQIVPEIEFWDKVTKDGTFAAFQTALKQAKTLEERWRIVDQFPEIAERSGMTEALTPRDSLKVKQ